MLFIAIGIGIESRGFFIFRQKRIGYGGKPFTLYKFRTMVTSNEEELQITVSGNSRITRLGKFLRRFRLDELPQLINVIRGDMSIVGPRPEVPKYVETYSEEQRLILNIKPGITDYASLYFREEEKLLQDHPDPESYYISNVIPCKIKLNKEFIENRNLVQYFGIIIKTFITLFRDLCKKH